MAEALGKIPQAKISSVDITSDEGGLDQRGKANIRPNSFSVGRNAMVNQQGLATYRLGLRRWLPDAVDTVYQVSSNYYNGVVYHIIADDGKIKFMVDGDSSWTDCGGDNIVTTVDTVNTFLRILDKVLILNGVENLGYVDLSTMDVVHFDHVDDPASAPTGALQGGLTSTPYKVYYCISYNTVAGKTASSPILTQGVSKIREQWSSAGTEGVTLTDPNTRPAGAIAWNVYLATAPAGGTIQFSDMLPIALGLDINTATFFDNGSITQLTNAGTAPTVNSTQGPKAKYGVAIDGRPFLYGITDDEYATLIGGDNEHALEFNESVGGYRLVLNQGTNFYPMSVVGFRNGQGIPSVTVLYSNVEGISKQSVIEQTTVSLGTFSAIVWGSTEQNYGAAGVSSPYATVNYRGLLAFPTADGILKLDTQASLQNVLSATRISDPVIKEVGTIKTELLNQIVGTAWANRIMFSVPARGYNYNNEILIYDVTRKGNECWYVFDIRAQWIGSVSLPNSAGFTYVVQDNHFFKLDEMYVAQDELPGGGTQAFPVEITSGLIGTNAAHNGYFAVVQAVFYLLEFVGTADLIVTWRDLQSGKMKTKKKTVTNGVYKKTSDGGWSDSAYQFTQHLPIRPLRWGDVAPLSDAQTPQKADLRFRIPLNNVVTNEMSATVAINLDNTGLIKRSVSFEGQPLGISADVR